MSSFDFSNFLQIFPGISEQDNLILIRLSKDFPEIINISTKFDGDFEAFIGMLRNNQIYRRHITVVKREITEEFKLPKWARSDMTAKEIKELNKKFEYISKEHKKISDVTIKANHSYNSIIIEAKDAANKIRKYYEDDLVFILKLKSNELTGADNADFVLNEASEYKKLEILISNGVSARHEFLDVTTDFSTFSPEQKTIVRKAIRTKIMSGFRQLYYDKVIKEKDETYVKHLAIVKLHCMNDLIVLKTIPGQTSDYQSATFIASNLTVN
jgi:hypothetical protein